MIVHSQLIPIQLKQQHVKSVWEASGCNICGQDTKVWTLGPVYLFSQEINTETFAKETKIEMCNFQSAFQSRCLVFAQKHLD